MRSLLCTCLIAAVAAGAAIPPFAAAGGDEGEVRSRLESVRKEIRSLRERIGRDEGNAGRLEAALRKAEGGVAQAAARVARTDGEAAAMDGSLRAIESRRRQEMKSLEEEIGHLAVAMGAAWQTGRRDRLQLLLNQQEPAAVGRALVWHEHLNRVRADRISTVGMAVEMLAATEREMQREREALDLMRERQQREVAALEDQRRERAGALAALRGELEKRRGTLTRLEQDGRQLEGLLRSIEEALADIPAVTPADTPFPSRRGHLEWPAAGEVRAGFGDNRMADGSLTWRGVFIAAPAGRPVRAVHHGRVVFSDWMRSLGNLVIVDHGDGYMSLYGHLQYSGSTVGEWVRAGDELGATGDSGGQSEAGLYLEIRHKGNPQNPVAWFTGRRPPRERQG